MPPDTLIQIRVTHIFIVLIQDNIKTLDSLIPTDHSLDI